MSDKDKKYIGMNFMMNNFKTASLFVNISYICRMTQKLRLMKYNCYIIISLLLMLLPSVSMSDAAAMDRINAKDRIQFLYDVDFDFRFDNREYDPSGFSPSMTVFGARLTPTVGLRVRDGKKSAHNLVLGVDIMKDFGSQKDWDLFKEILFYYDWDKTFGKTEFSLMAGIIPRKYMSDGYSPAYFSDSLKFYDTNIEGLLLKFRRPRAHYEIGCDWMGQQGQERRERFMIFSNGQADLTSWLFLGYSAYMYHFAGSRQVRGVVDNILLNPYIGFDFRKLTGMQRFSVSLGWLQSLQNDRRNVGKYVAPYGGELFLEAGHWNFGVRNRLFYGYDMMPYYNSTDAAGMKYGNLLYFGEPFFRVFEESKPFAGIYDRLEIYYEPRIADFVTLKVAAAFHFNRGYSGCSQIVALKFDLQSLLSKPVPRHRQ